MRRSLPKQVAWAVVLFAAGVSVYRAWTQSFTADESHAFNSILSGPISQVFNTYNATNHVLQSLLSWISYRVFGVSEFSLRLPSVIGGLAYLGVALRLSRYAFGAGWMLPLAVATLCLNPFVMDYLAVARGYSLACALFLWAFYGVVRHFGDGTGLRLAGVALGLSVASNLVFLYPAAGLFAVVVAIGWRRFWDLIDHLAGPALVAGFVFLAIPLSRATMAQFYYGSRSLHEFSDSVVKPALFHTANVWILFDRLPRTDWAEVIISKVAPALFLFAIAAWLWIALRSVRRRETKSLGPAGTLLLTAGGTLAASSVLIFATHFIFGVRYPMARTGIYLVLLLELCWLSIAAGWPERGWLAKAGGFMMTGWVSIMVALFALGFTAREFTEWSYDADTRDIVGVIRQRHAAGERRQIRVGPTWQLEATLNFYRARYRLDWIKHVERDGADGDYDYYVLLPEDHELIAKRRLMTIYRGPVSGAVVAIPRREGQ